MLAAPFSLPRDGPSYVSHVYEIADQLIRTGIWSGIDRDRLRLWRKNFISQEEQYFSACCLDKLLYRSEAQTLSMMRHLWQRKLPMLQRSMDDAGQSWLESLQGAKDVGVRVVPVVNPLQVTKSGYLVARLLEKRLRVRSRYIKAVESPDLRTARIVVFVDDFLGGGTQFEKTFTESGLLELGRTARIVYAPLVAHDIGVAHLQPILPNVSIVASEMLGERHRLLGPGSDAFLDGVNTAASAATFYGELLTRYGIKKMPPIAGVPHLGVAYAFQHAAPNNSLEIFWTPSAGSWAPLFDR